MKQLTLQPQQAWVQRGNNLFSSSSVASWAALGISNALSNLFQTLEGKTALNSPHVLSWEARELQLFESRLKEAFGYHVAPSQPFSLLLSPLNHLLQVLRHRRLQLWSEFIYTINAIIPTVYSSCSVSKSGEHPMSTIPWIWSLLYYLTLNKQSVFKRVTELRGFSNNHLQITTQG